MSEEGRFLVECAERYKTAKNLSGRQVSALFTSCRVWEYLYFCSEALRSGGGKYIVEDIDLYLEACG